MNTKLCVMIALSLCMFGCWGAKYPGGSVSKLAIEQPAPPPARIGHIVFVTLKDPGQADALRRDADYMLGNIPSVVTYACGQHLDTGRSTVLSDYTIAIYLGFDSESGLAEYVAHPQHVEFVEKWKPRLESLRVYDMLDEPNAERADASSYGVQRCVIVRRKKFLGIF